ncbi:hypothetical protein BDZ94DRAFT_1256269 [Collybia nuda]|uniref:Uncharacterized protein n=1 Tax=Collybia nuda TaxID=64659 RepID=A0A9P6CL35_9AGAR|nr:hypothetical protein BDZ94DRAFT_1256269 [Collybia nuda]
MRYLAQQSDLNISTCSEFLSFPPCRYGVHSLFYDRPLFSSKFEREGLSLILRIMDDNTIDEDSIDTEVLQAQIDISMAFAQNLVSSWVKPSPKFPAKSNRDVEAELQEYMRRPPRLGVGAAIPATQNLSRESARLKGQLIGKSSKRAREEVDNVSKEKSDDDDESRAKAIRKKARVDPFGEGKKKKKHKKPAKVINIVPRTTPISTIPIPQSTETEESHAIGMAAEGDGEKGASLAPSTPRQKKSKRKSEEGSAQASNDNMPTEDKQTKNLVVMPSRMSQPTDISLIETPIISSRFQRSSQSEDVLKKPVLNLAPQSNNESDDQTRVESPVDSSPKKRRKRKKKKNTQPAVTYA